MKGIDTLIKMHQRELDNYRREQVRVEEEKEALIAKAIKLQEDLIAEHELSVQSPEMGGYFAKYKEKVQNQQTEIAYKVAELEQQLMFLASKIAESFGELKKYELTKEARLKEEAERQKQNEQKQLDEVGSQQWQRKRESKASTDGGSSV